MRKVLFVAVCCMAMFAALTVTSPARTIYVPKTMSGTIERYSPGRLSFSFPATHIVFSWTGEEGTGVLYRRVGPSGPRGPWRLAPEWHDMEDEATDTHYSGVISLPRVSGVQVRPAGTEEDEDAVESIGVHYMNTLDGPREPRRIPAPQAANAAATTPNIVSRAEWGANESLKRTSGGCKRTFRPLQQLFVHHTAGSNSNTDSAATMRAVYEFHTVSRGWCDIGYNFVIGRDGRIFEGRWARNYAPFETPDSENRNGRVVTGAHTSGYNSGSLGVSLIGNYQNANLPAAARQSLVAVLAWIADRHNLDPKASKVYRNPDTGTSRTLRVISGHKDAGSTACPGTTVYSDLPKLRDDVALRIGSGRARSSIKLSSSAKRVRYGKSVTISGTLVNESGIPMPGRAVTTWARRNRWRVFGEHITDGSGRFSFNAEMPRNSRFAATYAGDPATWETQSKPRVVKVRPILTLDADGTQGGPGPHAFPAGIDRVIFRGTISPKLAGLKVRYMIFRQRPQGGWKLVKDRRRRINDNGGFKGGFKPRRTDVMFRAHVRRGPGNGYDKAVRANVRFFLEP